jgi:hypothetical protein
MLTNSEKALVNARFQEDECGRAIVTLSEFLRFPTVKQGFDGSFIVSYNDNDCYIK